MIISLVHTPAFPPKAFWEHRSGERAQSHSRITLRLKDCELSVRNVRRGKPSRMTAWRRRQQTGKRFQSLISNSLSCSNLSKRASRIGSPQRMNSIAPGSGSTSTPDRRAIVPWDRRGDRPNRQAVRPSGPRRPTFHCGCET